MDEISYSDKTNISPHRNIRCCGGTKVKQYKLETSQKIKGLKRDRKALTSYGEAAEAPFSLQLLCFSYCRCGRYNNGVQNKAIFVSLDLPHHLRLILYRAIMMNDSKTTEECHMDGHVVLRDGVHWGGEQWSLQRDSFCNRSLKIDIRRREP
jgi:hypothetical protein